jgi:hypothetical protein
MKDNDYAVSIDKQSGYINTECKPAIKLVIKCIICGNDVVISGWDNAPKVCDDCKKAIEYAKKLMEKDNER